MSQAHIISMGTAVPNIKMPQQEMAGFMADILGLGEYDRRKLRALYRLTAIENRYSVLSDFETDGSKGIYQQAEGIFPSTSARMEIYEEEAPILAQAAVQECFQKALLNFKSATDETTLKASITHLITVSCTGMYAPGLDIDLVMKLGLNPSVSRTCINFMGCYASFNALKVASSICQSDPSARVLIVGLELCTLHLQKSNSNDDLLANSLFADGAGAILLGQGEETFQSFSLEAFHCGLIPQGQADMAWRIHDSGFLMRLSTYVPDFLQESTQSLVQELLAKNNAEFPQVDHYAIHPGGKKILEVVEQSLDIPAQQNQFSWQVLREYGNMSSVTIIFVLQKLWERQSLTHSGENILSMAFGPGLTLETALLKIHRSE